MDDNGRGAKPPTRVFVSRSARRRFVVHAIIVVLFLAITAYVFRHELTLLTDPQEVRAIVRRAGTWGPLVFVLLQAGQVVIAPIPGQLLGVAAGYLFGLWWGTLYNMIGITIGSAVAFWLSRRFGRAYVERMVDPAALARFDGFDDDVVRLTLFVLFLVPGLPDDVICFAGGLTRVPLWQLIAIAVLGRAPAFFLVNLLGDFLGTERYAEGVALAAILIVLSAIVFYNRDRIIARLSR